MTFVNLTNIFLIDSSGASRRLVEPLHISVGAGVAVSNREQGGDHDASPRTVHDRPRGRNSPARELCSDSVRRGQQTTDAIENDSRAWPPYRSAGGPDSATAPASPPPLRGAGAECAATFGSYRAGMLLNLRKQPFVGPEPDGCCGSQAAVRRSGHWRPKVTISPHANRALKCRWASCGGSGLAWL